MTVGANAGCVSAGRTGEWASVALEVHVSSLSGVLNLTLGL